MAALSSFLLRRASSLIPHGSSSSVLHLHNCLLSARLLPFSTISASNLFTRIDSVAERIVPPPFISDPLLPIPAEFPFSVKDVQHVVSFIREDKDERIYFAVPLDSYQVTNGNPSFEMVIRIYRGYWGMWADVIAGPKMMSIREATMREDRKHNLRSLEEFLDTKGINARTINSLFNLYRKKKQQKKDSINIDT